MLLESEMNCTELDLTFLSILEAAKALVAELGHKAHTVLGMT